MLDQILKDGAVAPDSYYTYISESCRKRVLPQNKFTLASVNQLDKDRCTNIKVTNDKKPGKKVKPHNANM